MLWTIAKCIILSVRTPLLFSVTQGQSNALEAVVDFIHFVPKVAFSSPNLLPLASVNVPSR